MPLLLWFSYHLDKVNQLFLAAGGFFVWVFFYYFIFVGGFGCWFFVWVLFGLGLLVWLGLGFFFLRHTCTRFD